MAYNKVKFLRGTSDEYAVAEKDSDTIYFTTDDGKLYIGDKEVSGDGSITIDDTLSDTSTNPVQNKVIKQAIDNKADKSLYGDSTINVGRKAETTVGNYSTAEGNNTTASGAYSHAEGYKTIASGIGSHAEGCYTTAGGRYSHAGGYYTKALKIAEFAHGQYNQSNDNTLFSVGDGTADNARHNAFEITTTGGKLHDKDIATTDLIPTTLPANGGNADTVDGLHASDFVRAFNGSEMDNNRILIPNDVHVGDWLAANAEVGMQYYKRTDCSGQTGLPDGANDWAWFVYDGLIYIAKTSYNRFFIMDYINSYNGWKEISTTPIKSTGWVTTPTDQYGTIILPNSDTRRYLSITAAGCYAEMFAFNDEYTVHIVNGNYEKVINTPVKYIAFYIE